MRKRRRNPGFGGEKSPSDVGIEWMEEREGESEESTSSWSEVKRDLGWPGIYLRAGVGEKFGGSLSFICIVLAVFALKSSQPRFPQFQISASTFKFSIRRLAVEGSRLHVRQASCNRL